MTVSKLYNITYAYIPTDFACEETNFPLRYNMYVNRNGGKNLWRKSKSNKATL